MNRVAIAFLALVSVALALQEVERRPIAILKQSVSEPQPDGSYSYHYETENGINVAESGVGDSVHNPKLVDGYYSYPAPDGTPIEVRYTADEDGFHPVGAHVPPVPELIRRALDYIAAHPEQNGESR